MAPRKVGNIIYLPTMSFRLQAKHIALTYAQCPLDKKTIYDFLLKLSHPVTKVLVAEEEHQDGGRHYHAYIEFVRKPHIRDQRYFDLHEQHPNISSCRCPRKWIEYCSKEDPEPLSNFDCSGVPRVEQAYDAIQTAITEGKSSDECYQIALATDKSLLRCAGSVSHHINRIFKTPNVYLPEYDIQSFAISLADSIRIGEWINTVVTMEAGDRVNTRSLWFVGDSRLGKTALARSIGTHWYMQNQWSVENLTTVPNTYGVIDDLDWDSLTRYYKALLGCQKNITVTDKYVRKKSFTYGFPVIVCTNELPEFTLEQKKWLSVNVDFFHITSSILPNSPIVEFIKINI